jgi:pseudolysin/vibriolysin
MSSTWARRRDACVRNLTGFAIAALLGACGGGDSSSSIVTEAVNHQETENALAGPELEVAAPDYLLTYDDSMDLGLQGSDYQVTSVFQDGGLRHARMQQTYGGLPVFGADMVVHADDSTFLGFNGYVTKNLDGFDITTTVAESDALAAAKDDVSGGASLTTDSEETSLVILPGEKSGASVAWYVKFHNEKSGDIEPGIWNYFIDARSGEVLLKFDTLYTAAALQGSGPGGAGKKARTWTNELDVSADGEEFVMNSDRFETQDRGMADMDIRAMDMATFMDVPGNDAHGYAEITLNMMRDWMERDSLDDAGFKIISRVHDTSACKGAPNNACWNGSVMTYGDGGASFYPFSGDVDVVAHELNHGFTTFHSNLTYSGQSGGLNESFSDIAGTCAEHYAEGASANLTLGEDIMKADRPLRWMCDPTMDGVSIGDAKDFYAGINPHLSSGVPNRVFCLAVGRFTASSWGFDTLDSVEQMGYIWYTANGSYWTAGTTYEQACRGTIDAARSAGWDQEVVELLADSWKDAGVECETDVYVCNSDGTCDAADGETCASCGEDCGSCAQDCSFWKKQKCKIGIGDCSQCGDDSGCGDRICDGDETDDNCPQDCGCAAHDCEDLAPFGCYCDPICEDYGDCCSDADTCNI